MRNVNVILDHLGDINANEQVNKIRAMATSQEKMRNDHRRTRSFVRTEVFQLALEGRTSSYERYDYRQLRPLMHVR